MFQWYQVISSQHSEFNQPGLEAGFYLSRTNLIDLNGGAGIQEGRETKAFGFGSRHRGRCTFVKGYYVKDRSDRPD